MELQIETQDPALLPRVDDGIAAKLLKQRRVMLTGPIDGPLAERVCAQLLVLDADGDDDITLHIHSPGGEVDAGFAIYDTMQSLTCDVATVCMGFAASMGQFLLVGGASGKRFAHAHSRILMHQPLGQVQGYAADIAIQAEQFSVARELISKLTAMHCGTTLEQVRSDGDRDRWFTPEEAKNYGTKGMIDTIIGVRR
jgi:ATP-dependent Clp protease protease subunit